LADADLIHLPEPIPDSVRIDPTGGIRFSPNELRDLRVTSGRSMTELFQDGDDADRMQAMAWLELRRRGHRVTWDAAGDVAVELVTPTPDPTTGDSSTSSQPSADSGASPLPK